MIIAAHFYWMENVFIFSLLPCVCAEAEYTWLPRSGPYWAGLSFWTSLARWKVHSLFPGCERHQVESVFDRSQRHLLIQLWFGPKDQIWLRSSFKRKATLGTPSHNLSSPLGSYGVQASVSSLTLGRGWGEGESLSPPKSPGVHTVE